MNIKYNFRKMNTLFMSVILGSFLGFMTQPIFNLLGVYTGEKAIKYYGEVHQSKWNSLVHTAGMPFTYYGLLIFVPGLFGLNRKKTLFFQLFFYNYFISYYATLNLTVAAIVGALYLPSQAYAMNYYKYSFNRIVTTLYGFMVAFSALTIQEVFGHWLGGDPPSRIEAIPNAIWHAGFYSVWHIFYA